MKLKPIEGLEEKLKACEDAEELGAGHYALDLYDAEPPMTFEIEFTSKGTMCPAAAYLEYSDELRGYYMGERIRDKSIVQSALEQWTAAVVDTPAGE